MFFIMIVILIATQGGPRVPWAGAATTTPALGPEARLCQVNKVHQPTKLSVRYFKIKIK